VRALPGRAAARRALLPACGARDPATRRPGHGDVAAGRHGLEPDRPCARTVTARPTPGSPRSPGLRSSGTEFANRYRILEYAGAGRWARSTAPRNQARQVVALKFLRAQVGAEPRYLERLLNEVRTARQVAHPNVVPRLRRRRGRGRHFLSMEWIDGQTLASVLARRGRLPGDEDAPDRAPALRRARGGSRPRG